MSISGMTDDQTATLTRQGATYSDRGAKQLTFSTANRTADGLSTSISATFHVKGSDEKIAYGVKESNMLWHMYTSTDPVLSTEDQVQWTDNGSVARAARVVGPSYDMAGKGTIWKTAVAEMKNRS